MNEFIMYTSNKSEHCHIFRYNSDDMKANINISPKTNTISFSHEGITDQHKFIIFSEKPKKGYNTEAGFLLVDFYFKNLKLSRDKWKKEKRTLRVNWENHNKEKVQSLPLNYLIISEQIREFGKFEIDKFNLPPMKCFWLDHTLDIKLGYQVADHTGAMTLATGDTKNQYGEKYPINPKLQREGHLYTTFQPQLIKRIVRQRTKLIEESNNALTDDWVFDLRGLISDTISLLDITLTQFYLKAEYDPLPQWKFDKEKLGARHGRRIIDKLKWIHQVTGNNLNIEAERESLDTLKDIRNHLMHFDPPSLVITLEEATLWLNQIIDIGMILIKMRKAIGVEVSVELVNFILQKEAVFNPSILAHFTERKPVSKSSDKDYLSSTWVKI